MKIAFIRIFALATIGLVAGSALPIAFPGSGISSAFVFAFAISLALSRGFLAALPAVIALGIFADIATLGRIGVLSGFAVGLAYTASFFSRRFVVEHIALTTGFSGLLSGLAAASLPIFSDVLLYGPDGVFDRIADVFSVGHMLVSVLSGTAFFAFAVWMIGKHDDLIARIDPSAPLIRI